MSSSLTILLISGRPEAIRMAAREMAPWSAVDVRPFEEKWITSPSTVREQLKGTASPVVAFGCKDLGLQRFQFALKLYLLLYSPRERYLIDESARVVRVTWPRFLTADLARFGIEVAASVVVLLHAVVRLRGLHRQAEGRG
jgi:hypothetical protein